ncbi:MAG TPA: MFS transporter [Candidatus Tumulicola sp.]|nr:MFS transporter [Candidatus Tumulicola sp.]
MKARTSWPVVALLAGFILINFWDRAAVGFAGGAIMRDLGLSHAQFGLLGGAFFVLFPVSALLVGPLVDRWSPKRLVAATAVVWTVAQIAMSLARTLPLAVASRIVLGVGEGPAFPSALHSVFSAAPAARRPTVTALISLGAPLGIATGALVVTWATAAFGWRATFAMLGAVSLVWAIVWLRAPTTPAIENTSPGRPFRSIPFNSTALGVIVAAFGVYWILALGVTWFPSSLEALGKLTPVRVGQILGLSWALQALAFPLAARGCEALQRRGFTSERSLAMPACLALAVSGISLFGLAYSGGAVVSGVLITLCLGCVAISVTCLPPIVAEVTDAGERGTALSMFAAFSSTAGIVAPILFGRVVDLAPLREAGYRAAFSVSGVFLLALACAALLLMKPSRDRVADLTDDAGDLSAAVPS